MLFDLLVECVEESHAYGDDAIESQGPVVAARLV
jgi:hypothetical protein